MPGGSRSPGCCSAMPKTPELAAEQIELLDAQVDTVARSAAIGKLALQAPRLRLDRDTEGRWNVATWQGAVAPASIAASAPTAPASVSRLRAAIAASRRGIGAAASASGRFRTLAPEPRHPGDRQGPGQLHRPSASPCPPRSTSTTSRCRLQGWALDGAAAMPFQLRTRVAVPAGPSGRAVGAGVVGSVDARGELKASAGGLPQSAQATLAAQGPAAASARSVFR